MYLTVIIEGTKSHLISEMYLTLLILFSLYMTVDDTMNDSAFNGTKYNTIAIISRMENKAWLRKSSFLSGPVTSNI